MAEQLRLLPIYMRKEFALQEGHPLQCYSLLQSEKELDVMCSMYSGASLFSAG